MSTNLRKRDKDEEPPDIYFDLGLAAYTRAPFTRDFLVADKGEAATKIVESALTARGWKFWDGKTGAPAPVASKAESSKAEPVKVERDYTITDAGRRELDYQQRLAAADASKQLSATDAHEQLGAQAATTVPPATAPANSEAASGATQNEPQPTQPAEERTI